MSNHEFSIKVTAYGKTVTIAQVEDAVDIHEFLDMCKALATGIGFLDDSWQDAVVQLADEYTADRRAPNRGEELLIQTMLGKHANGTEC